MKPTPLSVDEFVHLQSLLDELSTLDIDGVLGVLHAIAVAPGLIPATRWLSLLFEERVFAQAELLAETIHLLARLEIDVMTGIVNGRLCIPDADDEEGCVAFANGYALAAERDPLWRNDPNRWTFAAPFAHLAQIHHLVPPDFGAKIEASDGDTLLRNQMDSVIVTTYGSFQKARLARAPRASTAQARARVGRNDPCPCASGIKFKRCCLLTPQSPSST